MDLLCFWGAALLQLWFGFRLIRNNFQGGKRSDPPLARSTTLSASNPAWEQEIVPE
ncbi:hypothetical protein [Neorhizobium vignae]|jgi:hypothetical protein|uniref:hypothetical protein n=1 Tax=Neorhizobium vignae TaxID=690585 RepID=UPI0012E26D3D|nr:hypothetical protein [Neorhizobium vignae]